MQLGVVQEFVFRFKNGGKEKEYSTAEAYETHKNLYHSATGCKYLEDYYQIVFIINILIKYIYKLTHLFFKSFAGSGRGDHARRCEEQGEQDFDQTNRYGL